MLVGRDKCAERLADLNTGDVIEAKGNLIAKTWKTHNYLDRVVAEIEIESVVLIWRKNRSQL